MCSTTRVHKDEVGGQIHVCFQELRGTSEEETRVAQDGRARGGDSSGTEQGKDAKCLPGQFPVNGWWNGHVRASPKRLQTKRLSTGVRESWQNNAVWGCHQDRSCSGITRGHLGKELPKSRTRVSGRTSLRNSQVCTTKEPAFESQCERAESTAPTS